MKIVQDLKDWRTLRSNFPHEQSIGFVATMGCLHDGHSSLIEKSSNDNDISVVSIFVNPTQFNDLKDFQNYPNTVEQDLKRLAELNVDYVILPDKEAMYPNGNDFSIITEHPIAQRLEGKFRPGHFNGVLTVVLKLLNLIKPKNVYFGEKDYQQFQLVDALVKDLFLDINVVPCPTIRYESSLPFSSRNSRLQQQEKILAEQASQLLHRTTTDNMDSIKIDLTALGIHIDYLELVDDRVFSAIRIGDIRLIDNWSLSS